MVVKGCLLPSYRIRLFADPLPQCGKGIRRICEQRRSVSCSTSGHAQIASTVQEIPTLAQTIVQSAEGLTSSSRVIICGGNASELLPHLLSRDIGDLLVVGKCRPTLQELQQKYQQASTLGNNTGVRVWEGSLEDLPPYLGPVDAVFVTAPRSSTSSKGSTDAMAPTDAMVLPHSLLLHSALLLRPGGVVVSSLTHQQRSGQDPALVEVSFANLQKLVWDLPLRASSCSSQDSTHIAVLKVPPRYSFEQAPLQLEGTVVTGFGRGSRSMGTPTANIAPAPLKQRLVGLPKGVYFGWAKLQTPPSWPTLDSAVHKVVLNIGSRPTLNNDEEDVTVECHIMHTFSADFYGQHLRVLALGFLRPEMRFGGLPQLIARIKTDIALARLQLDDPEAVAVRNDPFLGL